MEALEVEGIPSDQRTSVSDYLILLLKQVLPRFQDFVRQKARLKKKSAFGFVLTAVVFCSGTVTLIVGGMRSTAGTAILLLLVVLLVVFLLIALRALAATKTLRFTDETKRIGRAYVEFGLHRLENGSVMVDEDRVAASVSLTYPTMADFGAVLQEQQRYQAIRQSLPVILAGGKREPLPAQEELGVVSAHVFDEETELLQIYRRVGEKYQSVEKLRLDIGFMPADATLTNHLLNASYDNHAYAPELRTETEQGLRTIMGIVSRSRDGQETVDIDDASASLLRMLSQDICKIDLLRRKTLTEIMGSVGPRLSDIMHYGAYSFYCPHCHHDQLEMLTHQDFNAMKDSNTDPVAWNENARVHLEDWASERWRCELCERETRHPIPVHKLYSQVFLPAYAYLLLENEKERVRIYSELNSKKIEYQQHAEREKEEIERANRAELDEGMFRLRSLGAQAQSTGDTVAAMRTLMTRMASITAKKLADVENYAREVQQQIVQRNTAIEKEVRADVARMRAQTDSSMKALAYQARIEQQARDQVMVNMATSLRSINANTAAIASNTSRIASNTAISAAVDLAQARRAGMDQHPGWRVGANISRSVRVFSDKLSGRSELESAARGIR